MNDLPDPVLRLGPYVLLDEIGRGGMARVHLARMLGTAGFARTVAIKRLRPEHLQEDTYIAALVDEARVVARVSHSNVVQTLDVVLQGSELFVVMEYVHGVSLASLVLAATAPAPTGVTAAIIAGALRGLHAAHRATDPHGKSLELVHRDISPHNILIDTDGVSRLHDFGVAKSLGRVQHTRAGQVKGRPAYMAPEQVHGKVTSRSDIFAMGVVLWEALTGEKLFARRNDAETLAAVLGTRVERPSARGGRSSDALDAVVMKSLDRRPEHRYATALAMAQAIEAAVAPASSAEVAGWVERHAGAVLGARQARLLDIERAYPASPIPVVGVASITSSGARWPTPGRRWLAAGALLAAGAFGVAAMRARPPSKSDNVTPPHPVETIADMPAASPNLDGDLPIVSASTSASRSTPRARTRPAPAQTSSSCKPPYTVDEDGRHRYKRECF